METEGSPGVPVAGLVGVESADTEATGATSRRVLPALCLGTFVATLCFILPAPFFPAMARDLDVGVAALGQVVTAMLLLSAGLSLVVGPLADRYGDRRLVVLGLVAASACLLGFGLAPIYPALLLASLAGGLADATVLGLSLAIAGTRFAGQAARRAIAWTTATMAGAGIVGVPLLTAAGDVAGWRVAFVAAGMAALVVAWLGAAGLPMDARRPEEPLRPGAILGAYRPLLRNGWMLRLYGASVLRAVCWYGLLTYVGAFLGEEVGLGTRAVGLAYMIGGGGYFLGSLGAGGPLARVPPRPLLAGGTAAMALLVGLTLVAPVGIPGTIGLLALTCVAGGVGWVGLASLLTAETPAGAGTTMTLHGSLFNLGAAGGGAIGGLLLALAGYDGLALGLPLFGLASALLAWRPGRS